jgi:hypothetical protein
VGQTDDPYLFTEKTEVDGEFGEFENGRLEFLKRYFDVQRTLLTGD